MTALPLVRAALARRRRWLAAAAASLVVYAAIGFLLVPYALGRAAPARLEEALGRKVTIERIRVNPFTLSLRIDGFAVLDADGRTPALSWRSLFVDFELWPVLKREARFRAIRLVDPAVHAGLRKDGTPTFDDVIARLRGPEAAPGGAPADEGKAEPWTIAIGVLDVEAAFLRLRDESRPKPFETTAGPVTLHLESFRTTSDGRSPYAFSGRTEAGEAFSWTGTFQMAPVRSSGTLVLEDLDLAKYAPYYSDTLLAQLRGGRATARGTYEVNLGAERVIRLVDGEVRLRDLALHDRAGGARLLALPSLDVTGIRLDLLASTARVERVETSGGVLSVRRDRAGATNLEQVVAPSDSSEPFAYEVGAVAVRGWRIELDDRLPARPASLAVTDLDLTLERLSSAADAEAPLTASLGWPGGGKLRVEGTVAPSRPAVKLALDADALALAPLEPYLALYGGVLARLSEGSLRGKLRVTADLSNAGAPSYAVAGDAGLDGLVLLDANAEEIVRWRALEASAIDVRSGPEGVRLGALRLLEPRLRIVRRPDEKTNLEGLVAPPEAAPAAPASAKAPPERPAPFRVGTIAVDGGRVTVTDRTVSPAAVLRYAGLRARLTNFSSDARARTGVDVEALVEGTAPFRVSGTLNPRLVGDVTDLAVRSKGIDLTPLGPYSSRYVGYALERGKLDLDLRYRVQQRVLKAANVVRVDQLALGARSDSKDAPSFPMGLALAVLTDRNGVMLLDVPIEGNIDDPEFKLGRVIWRALLNVLGKVATAPFSALAGLVGGGADAKLDTVDFAPGSARLEPASLVKLDTLAKALADRPALKLEVEGLADASADGTALGRAALRALAARERWQHASAKQGEAAPAVLTVSDEEYPRYLKAAYESALRAQPARPVPTASGASPAAPSLEAMEAFLLQGVDLGAALRTLSSERAAAVREGLLARQIDQARLFLSESGGKEQAQPSVRLTLK
jgi:uncharacterized protein involved in outer membrane biogenesis